MLGNTMVDIVGMQNRCGSIFAQVANASCVLEDLQKEERKGGKNSGNKTRLSRLHAAHALSMDVVLGIGLEMGSHSGDCWRHVYRYYNFNHVKFPLFRFYVLPIFLEAI